MNPVLLRFSSIAFLLAFLADFCKSIPFSNNWKIGVLDFAITTPEDDVIFDSNNFLVLLFTIFSMFLYILSSNFFWKLVEISNDNVGSKTAHTSSPPTIKNSPHLFSLFTFLNISTNVSASEDFVISSRFLLKFPMNFRYSSSLSLEFIFLKVFFKFLKNSPKASPSLYTKPIKLSSFSKSSIFVFNSIISLLSLTVLLYSFI